MLYEELCPLSQKGTHTRGGGKRVCVIVSSMAEVSYCLLSNFLCVKAFRLSILISLDIWNMLKDPSFDVLFKNKALFMRSKLAVLRSISSRTFSKQKRFVSALIWTEWLTGSLLETSKPTHQSLFPHWSVHTEDSGPTFSLFIPPRVRRKGKGRRLVRGPVISELVFKPHHRKRGRGRSVQNPDVWMNFRTRHKSLVSSHHQSVICCTCFS